MPGKVINTSKYIGLMTSVNYILRSYPAKNGSQRARSFLSKKRPHLAPMLHLMNNFEMTFPWLKLIKLIPSRVQMGRSPWPISSKEGSNSLSTTSCLVLTMKLDAQGARMWQTICHHHLRTCMRKILHVWRQLLADNTLLRKKSNFLSSSASRFPRPSR